MRYRPSTLRTLPAATVWPMSRMAKLPSSGMSFEDSMQSGFWGRTVTTAASPDWMKIDPSSGEVAEESPDFIQSGDAAVVTVRPQKPLSIESSNDIPELGSFAIRDMGQTVAAGKVLSVDGR